MATLHTAILLLLYFDGQATLVDNTVDRQASRLDAVDRPEASLVLCRIARV